MKSYEQAVKHMTATHASQRATLRRAHEVAISDQMRAQSEEWAELDRQHSRDWFELRRIYKKPIGPAGLAMLAGVVSCTRR